MQVLGTCFLQTSGSLERTPKREKLAYNPWKPLTGQTNRQKVRFSKNKAIIIAIRIIAPKSIKVAKGLTVKNPENQVDTQKRITKGQRLRSLFGHLLFKPQDFCLPTLINFPL